MLLSTIIFFYGSTVFIKGAWGELKKQIARYDDAHQYWQLLQRMCIALQHSLAIGAKVSSRELATLVTIMLLGHWLEMASIAKAEEMPRYVSSKLLPSAEKTS
ncbi:MAG: hypothetical protein U0524_01770 [Candidatus Saccharimonadales bacterium]